MIDKRDILSKAIYECLVECYKWAQPSINVDELIKNKQIQETQDDKFMDRYYLSQENFKFIQEMFMDAYRIRNKWEDHVDLLVNYITSKDSKKDVYIPRNGDRPGYRGYKPIVPLNEVILNYLKEYFVLKDNNQSDIVEKDAKALQDKILKLVDTCKEFYKRDMDHEAFLINTALGWSPTSNKEKVEEYWKSHGRPNFTIKDFKVEEVIYGMPLRDENGTELKDENGFILYDEDITEESFIESLK
ncbi:hypothetical protein [Intestinibacter sp.]|uniref:hypothetical protein n=1 Tax=Intestinibacter sp. TaxID=1965304 RepID=UPI003F16071F